MAMGSSNRQNLAYQDLTEIPHDVAERIGKNVEELDLSYNRISDLKFLIEYPQLHTLVLDHNLIKSHVKMPELPLLQTLWVNHNRINNLSMLVLISFDSRRALTLGFCNQCEPRSDGIFISMVAKKCPSIRILSMMNNDAAPSYFNEGTYQQYVDYRYFVISRLPKLEALDDKKVEASERSEAERIYKPVRKEKSKRSASTHHLNTAS